ncbi:MULTISPECIES: hypothetical protein [Clostridia]|jgi:hypothetical protein|uniref:hypothetical protein n=1 Tax=Clostridia TaxID=186801 RepID=UPI001FAC382A|nr:MULTISPECIES: hypothetical protein [Eubacteriales]MDU7688690.1 hypothetical protein [Bacillota bacterium]
MDGLSGKNFSGGSVFPDNKAFRKLHFARCLKKRQPFLASLSNTEHLKICQKWAQKKQQIFFGFTALCAAAGRRDGYSVEIKEDGGTLVYRLFTNY